MKKLLIVGGVVLVGIGALITASLVRQGSDRRALAAYKAQLRAQGEWLTIEDAGYPFELEPNADLKVFTNLASQLTAGGGIAAQLEHMPFAGPGLLIMAWRQQVPVVHASNPNQPGSATWDKLASELDGVAPVLADLRVELETPPRRFQWNFTNMLEMQSPPYVPIRRTVHALAADTLMALHCNDLQRAQDDLHALSQMVQLLRDDPLLVSAMIRVATAGLGLGVTAQALHHEGWDEAQLAALQRDWESVNLIDAVERSFAGERIFGLQVLQWLREPAPTNRFSVIMAGSTPNASLKGRVLEQAATLYWRGHMDRDELFFIQRHQGMLDIVRDLKAQDNWSTLSERTRAHWDSYDGLLSETLGTIRYRFSAVTLPNLTRAVETTVRNDTQRRLTITAIALKRFYLRYGSYPRNLQTLVPEFLAEVPVDLWSGEPLQYILNPDGTFILYSVGENGVDDGGDPTPAAGSGKIEFWTGKDVVWPRVYTPSNADQQ